MGGRADAGLGDKQDGDLLRPSPLAAYDASFAAAQAAFAEPGAMERIAHLSYGNVPGAIYASHRTLDTFIHGWDLARATGQDDTLDPELVEAIYDTFKPQAKLIELSRLFDPVAPVPDDADPQTQLLALLGRER